MGRQRRIVGQGLIYHVIKRGNNRSAVFLEEEDYKHYLNCLQRYKKKYKFQLYAFCLMTNHVHLLMRVVGKAPISKIIQSITLAHIRFYNYKYQRTGHVWQGRFSSPVVSDDEYLLTAMQYIEQNPLRAGMVKSVAAYPWSSYKLNVRKYDSMLIDRKDNPVFVGLGKNDHERTAEYERLMKEELVDKKLDEIRKSAKEGIGFMSEKFKKQIEEMLPKKRQRGRPRKE